MGSEMFKGVWEALIAFGVFIGLVSAGVIWFVVWLIGHLQWI